MCMSCLGSFGAALGVNMFASYCDDDGPMPITGDMAFFSGRAPEILKMPDCSAQQLLARVMTMPEA